MEERRVGGEPLELDIVGALRALSDSLGSGMGVAGEARAILRDAAVLDTAEGEERLVLLVDAYFRPDRAPGTPESGVDLVLLLDPRTGRRHGIVYFLDPAGGHHASMVPRLAWMSETP